MAIRLRRPAAWRRLWSSSCSHRPAVSDARRLRILGPARAPLERLRGDYRFQILIKTTHRGELHRLLERGLAELEPSQRRRVHVDIDPHNLL